MILDYTFKDRNLLVEALAHPSIRNIKNVSYQRLEFLGDAILNSIIAEMLFKYFIHDNEGSLSKKHVQLVCSDTLYEIALELQIAPFIIMEQHARNNRNNYSQNVLENVLEALIAAIYLDSSFPRIKKFIHTHWSSRLYDLSLAPADPKNTLQEIVQNEHKVLPKYILLSQTGKDHKPVFTTQVEVPNQEPVIASGPSKKISDKNAAILMIKQIQNENEVNKD
ncbi:MAG: ribonuclease III [Candidatus Xenolissoclinum pacificiensis L6]|uniref:Ribonuclease 3 n=1 Tax=Candidatus Xenolissoclinum pacificiensis L6 TaxID=1401685 RepID=W2V098_9RICK|nr:MAG: ribonuclease III [Candidatus Xenolissoclinum pacificiensis L6]